jgi:hypothetical protein
VPLHFLSFFLSQLRFIVILILAAFPTFFLLPEEKILKSQCPSSVRFFVIRILPTFFLVSEILKSQ